MDARTFETEEIVRIPYLDTPSISRPATAGPRSPSPPHPFHSAPSSRWTRPRHSMLATRILCGAILAAVSWPVHALYESDVGKVDWHRPLIGVPLPRHTRFDAKRGLVIAASESNVLAALHASNGSIGMDGQSSSMRSIIHTDMYSLEIC